MTTRRRRPAGRRCALSSLARARGPCQGRPPLRVRPSMSCMTDMRSRSFEPNVSTRRTRTAPAARSHRRSRRVSRSAIRLVEATRHAKAYVTAAIRHAPRPRPWAWPARTLLPAMTTDRQVSPRRGRGGCPTSTSRSSIAILAGGLFGYLAPERRCSLVRSATGSSRS